MTRSSVEHELAARIADDPRHDAERSSGRGQHRPLLDMEFEERARERVARRDERPAPDAPDLLATEHDDGARPDPFDGLYRSHDAECSVEAASLRNGVEVRAGPHLRSASAPPDEVSVTVDLDGESRLLEPAGREPVRLVLGSREMRPVRTRAAADRIQLVEPLQDAHRASLVALQRAEPAPPDEWDDRRDREGERPGARRYARGE